MTTNLRAAGLTDTGQTRDHNEDALGWDVATGVAVVADGVGGRNAGEVASQLAVERISAGLRDGLRARSKAVAQGGAWVPTASLLEACVRRTNGLLFRTGSGAGEGQGMATTVVVAVFEDDQLTLTHVGDSRLYRLRGQDLFRMTEDHSLVQHMVQVGYLSAGEAQSSNYRNYVTRALGATAQVEFNVQEHPVQAGDRYLLCSDGLSNLIDDAEIANLVADPEAELEKLARTLVDLANQRGGPDNISVLLVDVV